MEIYFLRGLIIANLSPSEIKIKFQNQFGRSVSRSTIWRHKNPLSSCKLKRGPKRRTSKNQDEIIGQVVEANRWLSWSKLAYRLEEAGILISPRTVLRRMKEIGISSFIAKKKPALSDILASARLKLATDLEAMPDEFFTTLFCLDEGRINLLSEDTEKIWVKRRKGEALQQGIVKNKFKFRGGGVGCSFWCGVSGVGYGKIVFYDGTMTSDKYYNILETHLSSSAHLAGMAAFTILEDPSSQHKSRLVTQFYESHDVDRILIPGNSPDFNPIENVFYHLKKRVFRSRRRFFSIDSLRREILKQWNLMRDENLHLVQNLFQGYKRRMRSVITNLGFNTKY